MLKEELETWSTNPIIEEALIKVDLHVNTLGYLKDGPRCLVKFLDSNTEENR